MSSARSQAIIEKIKAKLATVDTANRTILLVFQFNFTDSDGTPLKSFVLDLKDLKVYEGTVENPDGELTISDADFYAWANKEVTQAQLLANEKVKISGNLEGFKKLMDKFHE